MSSKEIALKIFQQGVYGLAKWANFTLPEGCEYPEDCKAIEEAKKLFQWTEKTKIDSLRLLFDFVKLDKGQDWEYYWKPDAIADSTPPIPYPCNRKPTNDDLDNLKQQIAKDLTKLKLAQEDWQNLALLTLIVEKYGSFISFGETDIAFSDLIRSTAAVAAALGENTEATELCLVAGDLSGIQKFIYTISADGALKSLRARSFYLELVTEEVVQQVLAELNLPRTNVIYAGGGNIYILTGSNQAQVEEKINQIRDRFNKWLLEEFQGKIFLALDYVTLKTKDLNTKEISQAWKEAPRKLAKQKQRKFDNQLTDFLKCKPSYEPCKVCHRDDTNDLKQLSQEEDSVLACPTCKKMYDLGGKLLKVNTIVRSQQNQPDNSKDSLIFNFDKFKVYYYLSPSAKTVAQNSELALLVNNWKISDYQFRHCPNPTSFFLGQYAKKSSNSKEQNSTIRANELAEAADGIKRVGYLRMDVDKLGQIFANGLNENLTLPRLAGLSRMMTYFFKAYLNFLAEYRQINTQGFNKLTDKEHQNLLFIYAGGDDLFISGAWNEVVEFAFDIYQAFRAYTGYNPDITLSGGVSLAVSKFPLYQAASESGEAEEAAKNNGRDSLGLFGQVFKWDEWLGKFEIDFVQNQDKDYWKIIKNKPSKPELLGIFPFVSLLQQKQISVEYSRNFVRNLLKVAQIQERMIEDIENQRQEQYNYETQDIKYYLHLPQIAYTLARLPKKVLNNEDFRTSLKSPYNAPYFRAIATWIELLNR
ncbi:type III-A CRISPR-associated protein Cas10/Csm1 [Oscillatoria salina]|uniref:type III-A CRISPR-associated protein Cas10/Csm1 n=1 Tax=Oscillatoria salina TaxID=331517 RepID=UPI001CCC97DE|nr:type III-A CRISPR-associated protein Cas10/Csm1 [Oscillatoria salina]MBZ8182642.1 type III-A CRISPR-associated protein Cas10/Csm1 [Oscillatoria salina IIICB1]